MIIYIYIMKHQTINSYIKSEYRSKSEYIFINVNIYKCTSEYIVISLNI